MNVDFEENLENLKKDMANTLLSSLQMSSANTRNTLSEQRLDSKNGKRTCKSGKLKSK